MSGVSPNTSPIDDRRAACGIRSARLSARTGGSPHTRSIDRASTTLTLRVMALPDVASCEHLLRLEKGWREYSVSSTRPI